MMWSQKLVEIGPTIKLTAPQFVKQQVKTNNNHVADAEAVCSAVIRPNMRFVAINTDDLAQSMLAM